MILNFQSKFHIILIIEIFNCSNAVSISIDMIRNCCSTISSSEYYKNDIDENRNRGGTLHLLY
jgi:hypothetical protein